MITAIRHILTTFFFNLLLIITVLTFTFIKFPLRDWNLLITEKLFNIPYLGIIVVFNLILSLIIGLMTSQYWKQRIHYIDRQLHQIVNDQSLIKDETYNELQKVDSQLEEIQEKFRLQIEHSQRLMTERSLEREKSLQEVVLQERNRLAKDLHDSVSQQLFAASMMMSAINEMTESNDVDLVTLKHQLSMVEKMIQQSQMEMRALLLHLRPAALRGKTLHEGINDLLDELTNRVPIHIHKKVEVFSIDKGVEDQLFRILQEAISNTLRHADASQIQVMLILRDAIIILRIEDNGKGFQIKDVPTSSYGLDNMQERAKDIGGTLKIVSLPEKGTKIEVKVPYIAKESE